MFFHPSCKERAVDLDIPRITEKSSMFSTSALPEHFGRAHHRRCELEIGRRAIERPLDDADADVECSLLGRHAEELALKPAFLEKPGFIAFEKWA